MNKLFDLEFSKSDLELLLKIVKDKKLIQSLEELRLSKTLKNSLFVIKLDQNNIKLMLDVLTYALTEFGLDEKSEPNEAGLKIEKLIDKLSAHM